MKPYAGIGSRETPWEVGQVMTEVARKLARRGFTLRSGRADGADTFFEWGAGDRAQLWRPKDVLPPGSAEVAALVHPHWRRMPDHYRALHARNTPQVLGRRGEPPSLFVLCWTPDGCESQAERSGATGGTGQAIAIADIFGIPVFNMRRPDWRERLNHFLKEHRHASHP